MRAFVAEGGRQQPLNVIRHFERRFAACTGEFLGHFVKEVDFVNWAQIQVTEEGVHGLVAASCGPVKHRGVCLHCHRDDAVTELGEQGGEAKQERLPARCAFGAEGELAVTRLEHLWKSNISLKIHVFSRLGKVLC